MMYIQICIEIFKFDFRLDFKFEYIYTIGKGRQKTNETALVCKKSICKPNTFYRYGLRRLNTTNFFLFWPKKLQTNEKFLGWAEKFCKPKNFSRFGKPNANPASQFENVLVCDLLESARKKVFGF